MISVTLIGDVIIWYIESCLNYLNSKLYNRKYDGEASIYLKMISKHLLFIGKFNKWLFKMDFKRTLLVTKYLSYLQNAKNLIIFID